MFSIKQEPIALDLTSGNRRFLSSNSDHDETFSTEDETIDSIPKKTTSDSGFVDTTDENNASIAIKQESNHHYHSTPLRPQQIQAHLRHPSSSSSSNCSSPVPQEKECRNTRFLGTNAVAVLNKWFQLNRDYPYPDDERTEQLANEAGITQKQVKKWFANKRVRSQMCYKPLYRSRKMREAQTATTVRQTIQPNPTNVNFFPSSQIAAPLIPQNPFVFNPMFANSMMMLMMQQQQQQQQQQLLCSMLAGGTNASKQSDTTTNKVSTTSKATGDRITRFWL